MEDVESDSSNVQEKIMQCRNLNFPDEVIQSELNSIFNPIVKFNEFHLMNRKHFLKSGGMILACACGSSILNGCKAITGNSDTPLLVENSYEVIQGSIILDLSKIAELNREGGAVKVNLPSHDLKMIIAKTGKETFVALRDQCTHGGREMEYIPEESAFRCVSFGHSKFDAAEGNVLEGPAKSKLEKFTTLLTGEKLEIKFV